jgi:hypothetical protein
MNKYDIDKPYRYKDKWMIWPNTTWNNIRIASCKNTSRGECLMNVSLEDCIDKCHSDLCGGGWFINFPDGRTVCAPIVTKYAPDTNPIRNLRRQEIYPEFDGVKVSSFVNTNIFTFPPAISNVVFYHDILILHNPLLKISLCTSRLKNDSNAIFKRSDDKCLNIMFRPNTHILSKVSQYKPLRYGQLFSIAIPQSNLVLRKNIDSDYMEWQAVFNAFEESDYTFTLKSDNKADGELVTYSDNFTIIYSGFSRVFIDPETNLLKTTHQYTIDDKFGVFNVNSKMIGYYCDNSECKEIPISKCTPVNDTDLKYNGNSVTRMPNCIGNCKMTNNSSEINLYDTSNSNNNGVSSSTSNNWLWIIMVVLVILVILVIWFVF